MLNNKNHLMTWMLSFLLCFSNSFVVYGEEMTAPETAEEPAAEKAEETSEIPESSEEPVFEEALSEEEVTEPEENVTASEENQEQETEEVQTPEEQEFSEEEMPAETEEEPLPEETGSLPEETSEIPSETEEAEESELYAAETDPSNFTYDVGTDAVTITKYKGKETSVVVPYVIEGKPVTTIANYAFSSNYDIVSVVLPDSVTSIGDYVFAYCSKLESVTLPAGITAISESIFERCTSLKNVNIPAGVTSIGKSAFRECSSLAAITIPDTVETIDAYAFYKCSSLTTVVVPDSVVSLGDYVFAECTGLTNVKLPEKLSKIPGSLFYHCTSLPDFVFSENVTEIGGLAFAECTSLEHVIIPATVTNISSNAFKSCPGLTSIGTIGSGKNIEIEYGETLTSMYRLSNLYDNLTSLTIPAGVKTIGRDAFKRLNNLKEVIIPDTVTTLETQIFFENTGISHVVIPGSVTSCGSQNFYNCPNIKTAGPIGSGADIEFGWTETIPAQALRQSTYLTDVTLPEGITSIGGSAFAECTRLVNIDLPDTLTSLGIQAFRECTALTEITLPDSLTNMEKEVFEDCSGLVSIKLSKNVTKFGDMTFWGCSSLKSIELPEGFIGMGDSVFDGCASLESIYLPESMTDMGHSVFENCTSLKSVVLPKNVEFYGYLFRGCTNLETVVWPIGFTYIPAETFEDCTNLKHVDMTHVNYIGSLAFKNCTSLEHIDAERISRIDTSAFEGCTSLKSVSFMEFSGMQYDYASGQYINLSSVSTSVFNNCTSLEEIWISLPGDKITIGTGAFMNCPDGIKIHFFGTESQWAGKTVDTNNEPLSNAVMIYESVPTQLSLSASEIEIGKGKSMQLKYTVTPSSYNKDYLVWYSEKPEIVSVDKNGVITGNSDGYAYVHLTVPGSAPYLTCKVTVGTVKVKGVSIAAAPDMVSVGNLIDLDPVFVPENAENQNVTWSSSDSSIAAVDQNGIVKGIKVGTVTITVKTEDGGYTAEKEITVVQPVTGIDISEKELRLAINDTHQLIAAVKPEDASNQNVTWSSDHEDIVSVDETGLATAHADGTAVITAKTEDGGYTAQCTITAYTVRAISINIDEEESASEIEFGATGHVQVVFNPLNATNQKLSWKSSDESIATVDENGVVTAVGEGMVTITATSEDGGFTASKEINILFNHLTGISFKEESADIIIHESKKLELIYDPENASLKTVSWESSDESIATVDENGVVTAVGDGTATITATSKDGGYSASVEIHVIIPAQSIRISSEVTEILYGNTETMEVEFTPSNTTNQKVAWESSDDSIATVDENGVVTAVGEGKTTITATSEDGGFTASKEISILFTHIKSIAFTEEEVSGVTGETVQLKTVILPEDATVKDVTYKSDNEDVATVDENGLVKFLAGGKAYITVTTKDGEKTATVKVVGYPEGISVQKLPDYTYTGQAFKPEVKVYDKGVLLTEKTDYTVTYKNNVKAGEASVIIKSNKKGNYKDTQTVYFTIHPADIGEENPDITVDALSVQATGKPLSPIPVVYFKGKKLKNKTDYTVSYDNYGDRTIAGKHTVTITGIKNFSGKRDITVSVAPQDYVSVSKLKVSTKPISYSDLTGDFMTDFAGRITLKNGKEELVSEIEYTVLEDSAVNCDSIGSCTFNIEGKGRYVGQKTVTVKITGTSLTDKNIRTVLPVFVYTGDEIKLGKDFALLNNGVPLVEGTDYEITGYSKNINVGTATATLKGINNYTGTKKISFKITPVTDPVEDSRIHITDAFYSKGGSKPEVTIDGMTLNTDYTLKYTKNTKADTEGTVTVTFKGNYKGTPAKQMNFYINPRDISEVTVTSKDKVYSAKANAWKSAPVLSDTDGKKLKAGIDYEKEIKYTAADGSSLTEPVAAGTVITVTVTGTGNYTGTVFTTYRILETGKDISKAVFKIADQEYTGSEIFITDMSQFTETNGSKNAYITVNKQKEYLVLGEDFEVVPGSYVKNINKGTAKVTFRGINEYGGTKTVSFKIGQRSISDHWNGLMSFFADMF